MNFKGITKALSDSKKAKFGSFFLTPYKEVYFHKFTTSDGYPRYDPGNAISILNIRPGVKYNRDDIRNLATKYYKMVF